jgi:hypothetical protein
MTGLPVSTTKLATMVATIQALRVGRIPPPIVKDKRLDDSNDLVFSIETGKISLLGSGFHDSIGLTANQCFDALVSKTNESDKQKTINVFGLLNDHRIAACTLKYLHINKMPIKREVSP